MSYNPLPVQDGELLTVRDWVRYYVSEMQRAQVAYGHGCTNALDEAVYLVQHGLALPMGELNAYWDARVTRHEAKTLQANLHRRTVDRLPAAYITGQSWLMGQAFQVDPRVIIPRSFIAELLADELTPWVNSPDEPMQVLDLCTGSACLAILAAHVFENSQVDAVDLSDDALEVAKLNVAQHQLEDRVRLVKSDLFANLAGCQYDLILTNPPYVNAQSMGKLPAEYLHEPQMALAGGDTGMDLIAQILKDAPKHLSPGGLLVLELGNERPYFEACFPHITPVWLDVSAGSEQVFLISREELIAQA